MRDPKGECMRCLMCDTQLGYSALRDILSGDDPLCMDCRRKWRKKRISFRFEGYRLRSSYVYNEAFSKCLIQYKELADEALKDAFLYEDLRWFRRVYHGRQLVMMPSSPVKREARGFSHLKRMFECTGMEIIEPFVKPDETDQKKRSVRQRRRMEHGIFLKPDAAFAERIVLCDDTVTTGSTLKGALNALGDSCADIEIYTVSANRRWLR